MPGMIQVTQSWDDGVHDDVRLIELLRKYRAKATFNLISGAHRAERFSSWKYQDTKPVYHLALAELVELYRGFEVASHTVTHPHLEQLPPEKVDDCISVCKAESDETHWGALPRVRRLSAQVRNRRN